MSSLKEEIKPISLVAYCGKLKMAFHQPVHLVKCIIKYATKKKNPTPILHGHIILSFGTLKSGIARTNHHILLDKWPLIKAAGEPKYLQPVLCKSPRQLLWCMTDESNTSYF